MEKMCSKTPHLTLNKLFITILNIINYNIFYIV